MFYGQCWKCGQRWELGTAPTCVCKDETKEGEHIKKEDIIRMAREVGWIDYDLAEGREMRLLMFASTLLDAQREELAKECDNLSYLGIAAIHCASAIRARGNT